MPLITELLPSLAKGVRELLPEAKEPLRKMLNVLANPATRENIVAVEQAARQVAPMATDQWELWRNLSLPVAQAARAKRLGGKLDSGLSVGLEYLQDTNQVAKRGREAFNAGKVGAIPDIPKNVLPADTGALEVAGTTQRLGADLRKAREIAAASKHPKDIQRVDELQDEIKSMTPLAERAKGGRIRDIPWWSHYNFWSPKMKFESAMGEQTLAVDKAHSDHFMAGTEKMLTNWWYGLTGKKGIGKGFEDLSKNRQFVKDFDRFNNQAWPWLERYYGRMAEIGKKQAQLAKNPVVQKEIDKLMPQAQADLVEILKRYKPVAQKWYTRPGGKGADIRIALYREPAFRPWVEPLMEPGEKEVAQAHQGLMLKINSEMEGRGIPTIEAAEDYVHHSLKFIKGGNWRNLSAKEAKSVEQLASRISPFAHRNFGSLPLFPSIHASTKGYVRTAARKLAMTDLKNKWLPLMRGSEAPMKQFPKLLSTSEKYLGSFENNLLNDQWWDKLFHYTTMGVYATKTGLSPAVAFKHSLKFVRILSTNPYDAVRTMPKAVKGGLQIALQRFGVKTGKEAIFMRDFNASRSFFEAMSGIKPDKHILETMNLVGNAPVTFMEMIERGWTTMIALSKAQRKGLSMEKTMQGFWNMALNNNFLGGADRHLWMSKSWQQLAAPFMYTPLRVTEETIGMVLRSLPRKVIKGMGADALQYAWQKMPRDVYGMPYVKQLLYFAGATALLEEYARKHDASIWDIIAFHIPGLWPTATGHDVGLPPFQIYRDFSNRGGDVEALSSALFDYLTATPALDKFIQSQKGKVSPVYGGDPWRAMLSIPSQKKIKEFREKGASKQVRPGPHLQKYYDEQFHRLNTMLGGGLNKYLNLYPVIHPKKKGEPWRLGFPEKER